ncbi:MAG: DUF1080 domain-containing protein [Calditrichaeota bacterium]|nr:DUF1080 domain-containing protein [Calditrichota bacterium]
MKPWRLSMQLWTFHKYTFEQALDKTFQLGISWVEAYPGQKLSDKFPDLVFDHNLPPAYRKLAKQWLKERGLRLVNYGVVALPNDEAACRKVFDFAKEMGIETVVSEPPEEALDLVDRLAQEYKIKVAFHDHPKPSRYWSPDLVLKAVSGRSSYLGACADIGHWARSGIKPLDALKKLKGRVISLHFKDLNAFGDKKAHDVPWGTGTSDIPAVLRFLAEQNFSGVFSIEYEYNWTSSIPEIRRCIDFFNQQAQKYFPRQWKPLFANDLSNAVMNKDSWTLKDGVLALSGGGDLWTKERYGNFILDLEFKLAPETNSGVFLRTGSIENWLHTAIEVQVLDSYGKCPPDKHDCGAIFDCLEPSANAVKRPGEWNRYTIFCRDNKINVVLNGVPIIDMDLNLWSEAHKNPDGTPNKFNTAYKDMPREGHIGLQDHGHPVWYRNLKIKKLD